MLKDSRFKIFTFDLIILQQTNFMYINCIHHSQVKFTFFRGTMKEGSRNL